MSEKKSHNNNTNDKNNNAEWYKKHLKTLTDWVLRPFINGLMFGAGSYASKFLFEFFTNKKISTPTIASTSNTNLDTSQSPSDIYINNKSYASLIGITNANLNLINDIIRSDQYASYPNN